MSSVFLETALVLPENVQRNSLMLDADETHHLVRVRRKRLGDIFAATDGNGTTYECRIVSTSSSGLEAEIIDSSKGVGEPQFRLTLALPLLKREKFELVVEKGTELGITEFRPLLTEFTSLPRESFRAERIRKIAISAIKQCCRSRVPGIHEPVSFQEFLSMPAESKWIAHESTMDKSLALDIQEAIVGKRSAIIVVGPEGGFSDREVTSAIDADFMPLKLGPRRLRAETAALAATAIILRAQNEL